jgi:four helix bundle protein
MKLQITKNKLQISSNNQNANHPYDLEERTFIFARDVAEFCMTLPKTDVNLIYTKQVVRSSGSVGANYIEANECLGKKDFFLKIKTCRKEAKESAYWLRLILSMNTEKFSEDVNRLFNEAVELKKIFSSIANKG